MAEETLYDSEAMRRFAGIEPGDDRIPEETTTAACPAAEAQRPRTDQRVHRHHPPCQTSIC